MQGALPYAVLFAAAVAGANLPFLSERILFVFRPRHPPKALAWRLLEVVLMYFAALGLARALESAQGAVHAQKWEFYAATFCLFLVLAYPGFVWRYLWPGRRT